MHFSGKAHTVGANIDTDAIIPAKYLVSTDPEVLGRHCMAGLEPEWVQGVNPGDILVGGPNFGCGSSREHAPISIKAAGASCVIAENFARIFYRNCINIGLPIIECGDAAQDIEKGDVVEVDVAEGKIKNQRSGKEFKFEPLPEFAREIIEAGGLMKYVMKKKQNA